MEEKEVAQGLFDGGVRKTFCGKKEMYVASWQNQLFRSSPSSCPYPRKTRYRL